MDRDYALDTYRYLRGGIPVMLVMLGAALTIERMGATCWQTSISAYYYTSAHAVFIGTICAVGTLLIVYRGLKPTEDVLLNLAGVLAFVVAFVPTTRPMLCGATRLPVDAVTQAAIVANVWALVVGLAVSRAVSWWMYRHTGTGRELGFIARAALWAQRAVLAVGLATLIGAPSWFVANAHGIAATVMFAAIIGTVFLTAFLTDKGAAQSTNPQLYQRIYRIIAIAMAVTLSAAVVVHFVLSAFSHVVLMVEVVLIVLFGGYWVVQTVEKWKPPPEEPVAPPSQCTPAQERVLNAL